MSTSKKLFLLINSLSNSEKELIEKQLQNHPRKLYLDIFQKARDKRITKVSQLEEDFKGKISTTQFSKYCSDIYQLIIHQLENLHGFFEDNYPNPDLLREYFSIRRRGGIKEVSFQIREKIKQQNERFGNKIANYQLICQQLNDNINHGFSVKKQDQLIDELGDMLEELKIRHKIETIKKKFFEIRARNFQPSPESDDFKSLTALLEDEVFESDQTLYNHSLIYDWYSIQGTIYYSIGSHDESEKVFKAGIKRLLAIPQKNSETWYAIHMVYINLLVNITLSGKVENRPPIQKEMRHVFESNKDQINELAYQNAMFNLLREEILDCVKIPAWEKGLALVNRHWSELKDKSTMKSTTAPILSYKSFMSFGLERYDEAIDDLNEALEEWQQLFVFDFVVWLRLLIIICNIELKQYSIAISGIDALRKYMSYKKSETTNKESVLELLKVLRRWINNRGSGQHHKILEKYYETVKGKPPHSVLMDYFWVASKVENKSILEVATKYLNKTKSTS